MSTIDVVYDLTCPADGAEALARSIAFEQTVEVPEEVARAAGVGADMVGEVAALEPRASAPPFFRCTIRYGVELSAFQLPQLLNLIYGNVSIQAGIRIVEVRLPDELLARFDGPNLGGAGLRALLGVYDRPLLATALKPRGAALEHLAAIARDFALGGGDIIKDDHNLVDVSFDAFRARVTRCAAAVTEANQQTGRNTLYFPNLLPSWEELERQVDLILNLGLHGVLVCPFVIGLDAQRRLAQRYPLVVMAHPALAGTFFHDSTHGIAPDVALGTLLRLAGADLTVFPNAGGRFPFTLAQCVAIGERMREPLGDLKPGLPVPAGGMQYESLPRMAETYGAEAVFLIGGALLAHSPSVRDSTAEYLKHMSTRFSPRLAEPQRELVAGGGWRAGAASTATDTDGRSPLRFRADFTWEGRPASVYKTSQKLAFRDVVRHELLGQFGERGAFDLRYFEVAPGGFTSREKHEHIHAIICARGSGVLQLDEQCIPLRPFDVAHIPPLAVHQLRNETDEPFGFFCIVDRQRDRPRAP
ncbi:MAG: cupin domain-containing protein [Planctomycetes bacterium]|nr:cupin domain-containing protein [Planctomycetota bacterium]